MADERMSNRELELARWWDGIVRGDPAPAPAALDIETTALVERMHALAHAPTPAGARTRARRAVMQQIRRTQNGKGFEMNGVATLSDSFAPVFPGTRPKYGPPRPIAGPSRVQRRVSAALSVIASAALVAAILGLIVLFYDQNNQATPPPGPASPTSVPAPSTTQIEGWPMFGGNAARTRNMPGPGPEGEPVVLWTSREHGYGAVIDRGATANGVLYVEFTTGGTGAVDARTGQILWEASDYGGIAVVDGDGVLTYGYSQASGADLVRLDSADGSLVWSAEQGQIDPAWHPVIAEGVGYVPSGSGLIAFDPTSGEVLWRMALNAPASRGASVDGGLAVLGDQQGLVYGISVNGGDIVWTFQTDATTIGHPNLANGVVFFTAIGGAEEAYFALDAATGELKWRFVSPEGLTLRNAAVGEELIYLPCDDGTLYAVEIATGNVVWRFDAGTTTVNSPALIGDALYFVTNSGLAFSLDATTGTELWRLELDSGGDTQSLVVDGVQYFNTIAGTVYAIDGSNTTVTAATPAASETGAAATPSGQATAPSPAGTASGATVEFVWSTRGSAEDRIANGLGVRLSPDGTIWAWDSSSRFFIFDLDGNLLEIWGTPGSGPGQFALANPQAEAAGLTFAPDGSFWVVDTFNYRVQQFDKDRNFIREWGTRGTGDGQFLAAIFLTVDPDGNLLVSDPERNNIQRFDPEGNFLGTFDAAGTPSGPLTGPMGISFIGGKMYVGEAFANRIRIFDLDGNELGLLGANGPDFGGFSYPFGVYADENGYLYAVDTGGGRVVVFDAEGRYVFQFGERGEGDGQFIDLSDIAINRGGTVYALEWHGGRLQKFTITGEFPAAAEATPMP